MYRKAVVAIVQNNDGKYLLCQRSDDPNHWQFPQGGIEKNETEEETVLRELFEEVDIRRDTIIKKTKHLYSYLWNDAFKKLIEYTDLIAENPAWTGQTHRYFLIRMPGDEKQIQLKEEFKDYEWVPGDDILLKCSPLREKVYEKALLDLGIIRYRPGVCAVIQNRQGEFLLCQKNNDSRDWKFPSGGIEENETEEAALWRELQEEIGTNMLKIARKSDRKIPYLWPPEQRYRGLGFIGQEQRHFLLNFTGKDRDIHLDQKEFIAFQWVNKPDLFDKISAFRRATYRKAFRYLGL